VELARNKHGSDSQQLELLFFHTSVAEVTVYQGDRGLDCLGKQLELDLDNKQPVNEDFTVLGGQLWLCLEVVPDGVGLELLADQRLVDDLDVVSLGELVPLGHPHVADSALGQLLSLNVPWSWDEG